jgi:[protein-PII] uridylyltransferase
MDGSTREAVLSVAGFTDSMPERYRGTFAPAEIAEHAAIVGRRGAATAHVEVWKRLPDGITVIGVVADDRPGLLSRITASLVMHSMDIVSASAYTRRSPAGYGEAVDFLWLRRVPAGGPALSDAECVRIGDVLRALVEGELSLEAGELSVDAAMADLRPAPEVRQSFATRIALAESPNGELLMTIETSDRPGLLLAITRALFRAGVQIVSSTATTTNGLVSDRFNLVEADGSPIREKRRRSIQTDVLAAVDSVARPSSAPR